MTVQRSMNNVIKRHMVVLASGQALATHMFQLIPTIGPLIILNLTGSVALAGLAAAIATVGRMVAVYQTGRLMDRLGRARVLGLGFIIAIIGCVLTGLAVAASSFPVMVVGLLIVGVGFGAIQQNRVAAADLSPPQRRGQFVAYLLTASVVGSLAAPVFMGASSTVAGLQGSTVYIVAWFLVAVTLLPGLTSFFMLKPDPQEIAKNLHRYYPASQVSSSTSNVAPTKQRSTREILAFYPVTAAIVAAATTQGVMTMMMALFSLMMAEHGIFLVAISASITIHVIGMFGFSILLGRVADRMGRKKVLASCLVVSAVGALMIPMSQDYWFMTVGIFLVGLGWSGGIVASTAILADSTHPDERGRTIGVNDTISGGAAVSFPIIGGILIGLFGFAALGYASAIATIPALAAILLLREPKPGVYAAKPSAVRL